MQGQFASGESTWGRGLAAIVVCSVVTAVHAGVLFAAEEAPAAASDANSDELERILDRWERAVGELESLEADVIVWKHDPVFGDSSRSEGRLYYEKPDRLYFRTGPDKDGSGPLEVLIWNEQGLIAWDAPTKRFQLWFSKEELVKACRESREVKRRSFWETLRGGWVVDMKAQMSSPQSFLPALVERDADFRYRFEWTLDKTGGEVFLTGKPRRRVNGKSFTRVCVIIDPKTGLPGALQTVLPGGQQRHSFILYNIRLNRPPEDREALLNPKVDETRQGLYEWRPRNEKKTDHEILD